MMKLTIELIVVYGVFINRQVGIHVM